MDNQTYALTGFTIFLLVVYYFWYLVTVANHVRLVQETSIGTKVMFCMNQIIHLTLIFAALNGVFSRHFANGGIQLFIMALLNCYVYLLAYL